MRTKYGGYRTLANGNIGTFLSYVRAAEGRFAEFGYDDKRWNASNIHDVEYAIPGVE